VSEAPDGGVFVSVGTMMPFDRLLVAMDEWAAANPDVPVSFQIGKSAYQPKHGPAAALMPASEFRARVAGCRLFVAHAGMGSIITAIQAGKPMLMLPRLKAMGEHNTDHQLATARDIGSRPGLHVAADADALKRLATELLAEGAPPPAPIAPLADRVFTDRIRAWIEG
jgi:UDP-N-acetylglucosamine transferase subunit ALG13